MFRYNYGKEIQNDSKFFPYLLIAMLLSLTMILQGCGNNSKTEDGKNNDSSTEKAGQVLIHDNGTKKYYADIENMYKDTGGFYTLDVITESSNDGTFLKKDTWNFNRDDNTVFYRVYNVVGDLESSGMVADNDLATTIYSFIKNNTNYLKKVDHAPTLFKNSTKSKESSVVKKEKSNDTDDLIPLMNGYTPQLFVQKMNEVLTSQTNLQVTNIEKGSNNAYVATFNDGTNVILGIDANEQVLCVILMASSERLKNPSYKKDYVDKLISIMYTCQVPLEDTGSVLSNSLQNIGQKIKYKNLMTGRTIIVCHEMEPNNVLVGAITATPYNR